MGVESVVARHNLVYCGFKKMEVLMSEAFRDISRLRKNATEFSTFWDRYEKLIASSDVDKYGASFGGDSRFSNFQVRTHFESHYGIYGNSSCSNFGRFDTEIAERYMVMAMNCLRKELFSKCAELMRRDAGKMVSKAQDEVKAMSDALAECLRESEEVAAE